MASETDVVGEVESAGGRSKSSTVAPRYFCSQLVSSAEEAEEVGAGTPFDNACAIFCCRRGWRCLDVSEARCDSLW